MKNKALIKILVAVIVIGGGMSYLVYQSMKSSWSYYYSVDEFNNADQATKDSSLRIAGIVKTESVVRDIISNSLNFTLIGNQTQLPVLYIGTVPDNFIEDIEVVVEGRYDDAAGVFNADLLMTRCESKYEAKLE